MLSLAFTSLKLCTMRPERRGVWKQSQAEEIRALKLASITVVINFDWILVILKSSGNFDPYI